MTEKINKPTNQINEKHCTKNIDIHDTNNTLVIPSVGKQSEQPLLDHGYFKTLACNCISGCMKYIFCHICLFSRHFILEGSHKVSCDLNTNIIGLC